MIARDDFRVHGLDCAQEVALLRGRLGDVSGIEDLAFDVVNARMTVRYDDDRISPRQILKAVAQTGLRAEPWRDQELYEKPFWRRNLAAVLTSLSGLLLLAGLVVQYQESGDFLRSFLVHDHLQDHGHRYSSPFAVGLFIGAILCGVYFVAPKGLRSLFALRPDMNALVLISMAGAAVLGEWAEGATLAFLFAVATQLEHWSMARARKAVGALVQIAPEEATLVHGDHEHRVQVGQLRVGSTVRVKPGERIPCDGEVTQGSSAVTESMITGEPMPVWKSAGDAVFAGTVNGDGSIDVRTTKLASDTTLARIIRMVEESQHRRARTEAFVDQFARYYTPAMFLLAALVIAVPPVFFGGQLAHWFYQGMLLLLISCPCALVISTPVTIVAAVASAAREGVLIKGGVFLEQAAQVRAIAFDKTGVLTQGRPAVQSVYPLNGHTAQELIRKLAGLEGHSEHPLAAAVVEYAREQGVLPESASGFRALQGRGAEAEFEGRAFWAGNARLLRERGVALGELEQTMARLEEGANTVIACGSGDEAWGLVRLTDPLRPQAAAAVRALRELGLRPVVMLTGDNRVTAQAVASQIGVDEVRAELVPDDKLAAMRELIGRYGKAAMVGDGINDAQAIAEATLGISLGSQGTDVALETADVVLMGDDLSKLPFLIQHARRALRVIKENVAIALALKGVFLVLALFGLATLWMAVLADMGATLIVVFNGMRMLRTRSAGAAVPELHPAEQSV